MTEGGRRATVRLRVPNPLFEKWIEEWRAEAAPRNQLLGLKFQNALESLRKFPITLNSGKECIILEHFDTQLCVQLDRKLAEHNRSGAGTTESIVTQATKKPGPSKSKKSPNAENKGKKKREYIPNYRSASYAILVALHHKESSPGYPGFLTKDELTREAQRHTDTSFKKPLPGSFYTGWSSMAQLITKELVKKTGNPAKFSLTTSGKQLASQLISAAQSNPEFNERHLLSPLKPQVVESKKATEVKAPQLTCAAELLAPSKPRGKKKKAPNWDEPESTGVCDKETYIFLPGTFDVCLLVDTAETIGKLKRHKDETVSELTLRGVNFEVRNLKVGDFLWVCKHRELNKEIVLPYIVERKRLDDLASSITDGRFHEQKFRLKRSGIHNLIYLVEEIGRAKTGIPLTTLLQAVTNTQVIDQFRVKISENHADSMGYLANLTTLLSNIFKEKVLISCQRDDLSPECDLQSDSMSLMSFDTFSASIGKTRNFSVREMFVKQLIQLHGLSVDKAWAITETYETPAALISGALERGDDFLSNIQYGPLKRRVGPASSKALHNLYTRPSF